MNKNIYEENGYESREAYLESLADDFGVSKNTVTTLADMLGPNEDFDGLVCELEDYVMMYGTECSQYRD